MYGSGFSSNNNAITPVTQGVAIDVPLISACPVFDVCEQDTMPTPGAHTSGRMRPKSVFSSVPNVATLPLWFVTKARIIHV